MVYKGSGMCAFKVLKELRRQSKEDCHKIKASPLSFMVSNKAARETEQYPVTEKHAERRKLPLKNTISSKIVFQNSKGQIRARER